MNAKLLQVLVLLACCVTDAQARHHSAHANSDAQAGQFDYYVLSLSWAPTYCLTHRDDGAECGGRGYGFVVHGLWPQYDAGGYPENCATQFEVTPEAETKGRTLYPSEHLMQHEWREHGTCSGLDALTYFETVDRATAVLKTPDTFEAPRNSQSLSASQIAGLFQNANPQLPANALIVACGRGDLAEVRMCLTKDLALRSCGRGVRTTCPQSAVTVPASR
jgi:ribonuclease T2